MYFFIVTFFKTLQKKYLKLIKYIYLIATFQIVEATFPVIFKFHIMIYKETFLSGLEIQKRNKLIIIYVNNGVKIIID